MTELVRHAMSYAEIAHRGQKYDDGRDFIVHPAQVASVVEMVTDDQDLIAAAWLHDTIEDTSTTYEDLLDLFGERIADLVNELTHEGKADSVGYYFPRLKSREGILLKFADRLSNLSNMDVWDPPKQAHYLKKSKFWKDENDVAKILELAESRTRG